MRLLVVLALIVSLPTSKSLAQSNSPTDASSADFGFLVEDDVRFLRQQIRSLNTEIRKLSDLKTELESIPPPEAPVATTPKNWQRLQEILASIEEAPAKADVTEKATELFSGLEATFGRSNEPLGEIRRTISRVQRQYDRGSDEYRILSRATTRAQEEVVTAYERLKKELPEIGPLMDQDLDPVFYRYGGFDEHITKDSILELLPALKTLLNSPPTELLSKVASEAAASARAYRKSCIDAAGEALDRRKQDLADVRQQLGEKIKLLREVEQKEQALRTQIDQSLVYAVYGMIVVLLLLFLSLKVFSDEIAKQLIDKRSLVEVIGMAFMLITIIILGTGEKLGREILGTLLGTIAGYIFARGIQKPREDAR